MRRGAVAVARAVAGILLLVAVLALVTDRPGDPTLYPPSPSGPAVDVYVVAGAFHSGIVLATAPLAQAGGDAGLAALVQVTQRFAAYRWLEIGWGEEEFYREVPTLGDLHPGQALRALFRPGNGSVLHVVGLDTDPRVVFRAGDVARVSTSAAGFRRLAGLLDATFARSPDGSILDAGPGLYGPSRFFRATGTFSILNVCNQWVGRLLNAAGLPNSPVLSELPAGLLLDLRWRSGVRLLPPDADTQVLP